MVRLLGRCLPIICMPRKKRQSFPICEQQTNGTKHQDEINKLFVRRVESIRVTHQGSGLKRLPLQTIRERHPEHKKTKSKSIRHKNEKVIKPDDTEFDCETHISDRQTKQKNRTKSKKKTSSSIKEKPNENNATRSRSSLEKLFNKTKKMKTPSPTRSSIIDGPAEDDDDDDDDEQDDTSSISSSSSTSSSTSDWSTSTYQDSQNSEKSDDLIQRRQSMPALILTNRTHEMKHRSCVESFYLGREHVRPSSSPPRTKNSQLKINEDQNKNKNSQQQQQSQENKRYDVKPSAKSKQVLQNVRNMMKDHNVQEQHFNHARQRESVRL